MQKYAGALTALATEREFPHWLTRGAVYRGWALAAHGHLDEGISEMREGITASRKMGAETWQPYFRVLLADLYNKKGQPETGLALVIEALSMMDKTRERIAESELYRLKGELILQQFNVQGSTFKVENSQSAFPNPHLEAKQCFHKAIDIARQQQAKSFELRAVMSLAYLWQQQGKYHEAHHMLSEIYNWFTEGFDTKDLQEARVLLESLGSRKVKRQSAKVKSSNS